jgi:hypothetical protein
VLARTIEWVFAPLRAALATIADQPPALPTLRNYPYGS